MPILTDSAFVRHSTALHTVRVTVKLPLLVYTWDGFFSDEKLPSPKSHLNVGLSSSLNGSR